MPDDATTTPAFAVPELALGDGTAAYDAAVERARDEEWTERLWDRDPSLWSTNERVQAAIAERLGWLDAPAHFADQVAALEGFGEGIRDAGFTTAVVGGMGGSSLAPDILNRTFGTAEGWLDLRVLDSTDPAAVAAAVDDLDPLATLWIVASKSGTTTEPLAFQADAWERAERALRAHHAPRHEHAGELMIAITDPGKSVEAIPRHDDLREVFLNPADIGGRYSALTYVGLVPASLIGIDLDALLAAALAMAGACREPDPAVNPGVSLGLAIGTLAKAGRDKLTFIADPAIESFGAWAEQLIAESTGKHGVGIVPVDGEPIGEIAAYGPDRVFVRLALAGSGGHAAGDGLVDAAAADGRPVIRITVADPIDLGAEAFRWEVATAIAGAVLGIDPFDQPNVEEAKNLTRNVLAAAESGGAPPPPAPALVADTASGLALHGDAALRLTAGDGTLVGELARHLARRKSNAYLALQAFIVPTTATDAALQRIRVLLRDATRCATTAGFGPRFLHSTGQLHKGGTPSGWFLQLTSDHPVDRPIPGWPYTFGRLIDAQAEGDFAAIESHDLPILRVHLADPERGLAALEAALREALAAG
ncbi:MAG: transaldolase [Chloroflexi bacterium]|nr:transaldolase [Chloroflexota bacterium]